MKIQIYAPQDYIKLSSQQREKICNGCGAKGGISVPNTFWGLDISEACNVHDYMYFIGKTYSDKQEADRVFRNNLSRIIEARTSWGFLKRLRHRRKKTYCLFVEEWGDTAYWKHKNRPKNILEIA